MTPTPWKQCLATEKFHIPRATDQMRDLKKFTGINGSVLQKRNSASNAQELHVFALTHWYADKNKLCIKGLILGLCPANETALLCNDVSHWLGTNLESALYNTSGLSQDYGLVLFTVKEKNQKQSFLPPNLLRWTIMTRVWLCIKLQVL